jgi:hypothetical protein
MIQRRGRIPVDQHRVPTAAEYNILEGVPRWPKVGRGYGVQEQDLLRV